MSNEEKDLDWIEVRGLLRDKRYIAKIDGKFFLSSTKNGSWESLANFKRSLKNTLRYCTVDDFLGYLGPRFEWIEL